MSARGLRHRVWVVGSESVGTGLKTTPRARTRTRDWKAATRKVRAFALYHDHDPRRYGAPLDTQILDYLDRMQPPKVVSAITDYLGHGLSGRGSLAIWQVQRLFPTEVA